MLRTGPGGKPRRPPSMLALVLVTGVGPFATDTYLAALPQLRATLNTSAAVVQLTLTAFIVGLAAGQLILGPISDGTGRRRMLLVSTAVFTGASALCALAPNGWLLVAARLVQGTMAGGGVAVGRAVITDHYRGPAAAARFGTLAAITFLGPVLAPALGGAVLEVGTWRTVFGLLTALGMAMLLAVWVALPETLPPLARQGTGLGASVARTVDLSRDWRFMQHVAVQCLAAAGFFSYIGGSSFVLQTVYRISPGRYATIFAGNAAAMALASVLFRVLVPRTGPGPLRWLGIGLSAAASGGLLALALTDPQAGAPLALVWALLCLVVAGMGLSIPAATALGQQAGRRSAGTAAAVQGGLAFLVGAAVTPATGVLGYHRLLPMAATMAAAYAAAALLLAVTSRRFRRN